jgi:hypothetical protein
MYEHLGKKTVCTAFYTKAKDGICIDWSGEDGDPAFVSRNGIKGEMLHFEGDGVIKTLYNLVNKEFSGVCVGEIVLPITELLYTDIDYNPYWEKSFVGKQIEQTCECYIVYYANNLKHYVPKECCVFVDVTDKYVGGNEKGGAK